MKNKNVIKKFIKRHGKADLMVIVCTVFIFAVLAVSVYSYSAVSTNIDKESENTLIKFGEPVAELDYQKSYQSPYTVPTEGPTPTPIGLQKTVGEWRYFHDPTGFSYKAPKSWDIRAYNGGYITIKPYGIDEYAYPTSYNSLDIDLLESAFNDNKNTSEKLKNLNVISNKSYLTQINGKNALVDLMVYGGDPPENWQTDWVRGKLKNMFIDAGNGKTLRVYYWCNNGDQGEKDMKLFDEVVDSIKFD
jgi:hypothetical protein